MAGACPLRKLGDWAPSMNSLRVSLRLACAIALPGAGQALSPNLGACRKWLMLQLMLDIHV